MQEEILRSAFRPWNSPEHSGFNRLPAHGLFFPFPSAKEALADALGGPRLRDLARNPWYASLDGTWDFHYFDSPEKVSHELLGPTVTKSGFPILVPGSWTVQGWDKPHYTNVVMPFANDAPSAPEENPTGVYRRTFTVGKKWIDRRTVLRVGSAESYLEAYVNGVLVGSSKDTRLPAEFDVTDHVREGENSLALMVVRYSDASYIEDQDQWWFGGIHRSVCLYSTSRAYLCDAEVRPSATDDFSSGEIVARVAVGFGSGTTGLEETKVLVTAYDPDGQAIGTAEATIDPVYQRSRREAFLAIPVKFPKPWSSEKPTLYAVTLSLVSSDGAELDHRALRIGFRSVKISRRRLLINGKRVFLKGVNRHEHDERMAKTLTTEGMVEDILLMKRHNFNAVRASHYPNDERWYELCDEFGLYVWDEANIENHAYYDHMSRSQRWASAYIERVQRMVYRDKNHASIIAWSLGNESGYGENHDMLTAWVHRFDPTRPVHYEGGSRAEWGQPWHSLESLRRGKSVTDIVSAMYPPIELMKRWDVEVDAADDERPFIMCEFSHAMGNSNGSLADYWEAIESSRGMQGGFIWDWVDQGILVDRDGKPVGPRISSAASGPAGAPPALQSPAWRYGGDFGDRPCDYDFCLNGIVFPDRKPKPAMAECFKVFQPIRIRSAHPGSGRFTFENRQDFSDSSNLVLSWRVVRDEVGESVPVEDLRALFGTVDLPSVGPGESADFSIPELLGDPARSILCREECFIRFEATIRFALPWAEAGSLVAWEQLRLSSAPDFGARCSVEGTASRAVGASGALTVAGNSYAAVFSPEGFLTSFTAASGEELLSGPLAMNLFRTPTENDGLKNFDHLKGNPAFSFYFENKAAPPWLEVGLDSLRFELVRDAAAEAAAVSGGDILFTHRVFAGNGAEIGSFSQRWAMGANLAVARFSFFLGDAVSEYPRVGIAAPLSPRWGDVSWFGRGPGENYPDRNAGSPVGPYRRALDELYVPYTVPQENGCRTETRRLDLISRGDDGKNRGVGVRLSFATPCSFGATRFDPKAMWKAKHADELDPMPGSILFVDAATRGVGSATCGPDTREEYRVRPGAYRLAFAIGFA